MAEQRVYCQVVDLSAGRLPLALLRQAAARIQGHGSLADVGLARQNGRVVLKFYLRLPREEKHG